MITGASGFLGRHLIEDLLNMTEHRVIALTSQAEKLHALFPSFNDRLSIVSSEEYSSLSYREVDVLVNCAFPRNEDGTKMAEGLHFIAGLLKAAADGGVGAVINISSQSVYSQQRTEPATEETSLNLESKYAVGKYASELLTNIICADIPHTNLRLASLIGVGFDQRITNKLIDQALSGNVLHIMTGNQHYGFLDVRDAADAIVKMCENNPFQWDEIYNLGTNNSYNLYEIMEEICVIYNTYFEKPLFFSTETNEKVFNSSIVCRKFMETFQWSSTYPLSATLQWIFDSKQKIITR